MGDRYRSAGGPLVHGDYFPGSWLRTDVGIRIIDPEFCFQGDREIDVGCAVAHLVLARQPPAVAQRFLDGYGSCACDPGAIARYAAMEIVRRLIGVAQLPIAPTERLASRGALARAPGGAGRQPRAAVGPGMTARCIVTGANSGIGREIATALARDGAAVTLVCRSRERGEEAAAAIRDATGNPRVDLVVCDVGDQQAVRACCDVLRAGAARIDVLVNNAGVFAPRRGLTAGGHEVMLAVNHLGPFLMTNLLLDRLDGARVVTTSSRAHAFARIDLDDLDAARRFSAMRQYGVTKLANILFTRELARRAPRLVATCFHPGAVGSEFGQDDPGSDAIRDAARETLPAHAGARRRHGDLARDGAGGRVAVGAVRRRSTRPDAARSGHRRRPGRRALARQRAAGRARVVSPVTPCSRTGPLLFRSSSSALPRTSRSGSVPTCA